MRWSLALGTVVLLATGLAFVPVDQAWAADPSCSSSAADSPIIEAVPWAQQMYDPANQIWPFSRGAGVTVAVVDAGVDATHAQLQGKVLPGIGYLQGFPTGTIDCVPHGTGVASIIAGQQIDGVGFAGLAPDATILPVRVSDRTFTAPGDENLDPAVLAAGINFAVDNGARVIAVSTVAYADSPELKAAAAKALAAGVVVVAAVGDGQLQGNGDQVPTPFLPYPAAYPGVLGVGAIDQDGLRASGSQVGTYVDLVAPGVDITAAGFGGHTLLAGTGVAVAFVAATVALMLAEPGTDLTSLGGPQLVNRLSGHLFASADGAVGGRGNLGYGSGAVDPYRALAEVPAGSLPLDIAGREAPPRDEAAIQLAADRAAAQASSMRNALSLSGLALVIFAAAFFVPRARRRRWRAGRDREMQPERDDKRPEFLPGEMLFRQSASNDTTRQ